MRTVSGFRMKHCQTTKPMMPQRTSLALSPTPTYGHNCDRRCNTIECSIPVWGLAVWAKEPEPWAALGHQPRQQSPTAALRHARVQALPCRRPAWMGQAGALRGQQHGRVGEGVGSLTL